MKATFQQRGTCTLHVLLVPETEHEELLLACWVRCHKTQCGLIVTRWDTGRIKNVALGAWVGPV